ncbi:MAG: dipeptide epimerase [Bacteroidales bacterium]|jgi:L-alanine-DL-glutamate epimerase-like enolase superfamily enzyme|nr:dipeptide epimerase [Bacteroidales bacterium]NLK53651.1 dipeptide epimerase [Bacteroidales bacterium]HPB12855.1 dipeptide epimerase [Bacteroidales bacterium]HPX43121.1 dipeptide epimerase [Bacteroidales bacterium]
MNKREFLKYSTFLIGGTMIGTQAEAAMPFFTTGRGKRKRSGRLTLRFTPYTLQLKHVFTLATSSRTTTPVVLTEIEYDGVTGYGEASMPPYLGESHESVSAFLSRLDLAQFSDPFMLVDILEYVENLMPGNPAAKASVDIALHDLIGKLVGEPFYRLFGLNPARAPLTSFTIGLDTPEVIRQKVLEAEPYKLLKVKLGRDNDREMIEVIRSLTDKPLCADVNQGWKDRNHALEMAWWLKEKGVVFLEQPMPKEMKDDNAWLSSESPIPIIGDEAVRNIPELMSNRDVYSGINIKLMKCGGMNNAMKMINIARAFGMKVMIGCMTETSCAISAAAQLSPLVDWCDLDGNLLISNDPFMGLNVVDGKVALPDKPGLGITKI